MKNKDILIILAITAIISFCIGFYIYKIKVFSNDPQDWGAFGEFFNFIVGAINLIILFRISQIAHNIQKKILIKQLITDVYKDFLQRIDNNSESIIESLIVSDPSSPKKIETLSHIMLTTVENAKIDFQVILNETNPLFSTLCDNLITSIINIRDNKDLTNNQTLLNTLLNTKSNIRKYIYTQINTLSI